MDTDKPKVVTLRGSLVVDYVRNTVHFKYLFKDTGFQLPLAPLDIDIAKQLSDYGKSKQTQEAGIGRDETPVGKTEV